MIMLKNFDMRRWVFIAAIGALSVIFWQVRQHHLARLRNFEGIARENSALQADLRNWAGSHRTLVGQALWMVVGQNLTVCNEVLCQIPYRERMLVRSSQLSPEYRFSLSLGAAALGLRTREVPQAIDLYHRAIALHPREWAFPYRLAYHFMFDEEDPEYASILLERAAQLGGPSWVYQLAEKKRKEAGDAAVARFEAEQLILRSLSDQEAEAFDLDRSQN